MKESYELYCLRFPSLLDWIGGNLLGLLCKSDTYVSLMGATAPTVALCESFALELR